MVSDELKPYESFFRAGLGSLPESTLINGALALGGQALGFTEQETTNLDSLLATTYSKIQADSAFANLPSALPYCLSTQRHTNGHYFISLPKHLKARSPVIVFLHGYGGNFLFYVWALRTSLPDAIIICPSWNEGWYGGSARYVQESIRDARQRYHFESTNQWLMGISAGGRAGFDIYSRAASGFRGYISLASAPENSSISWLNKRSHILMINGTSDPMVPISYARTQAAMLKRRNPSLALFELPADHFFILSLPEKCFRLIRQFCQMP